MYGSKLPKEAIWTVCTFWLYTVLVAQESYEMSSRQLMRSLGAKRIPSRPLWHPIHSLSVYQGCKSYRISVVDRLYERNLSLSSSVGLRADDLQAVINTVRGSASCTTMPASGSQT